MITLAVVENNNVNLKLDVKESANLESDKSPNYIETPNNSVSSNNTELNIERDSMDYSEKPEFNQGSSELKNQLSLDNEELKRRLSAFDRVLEENRALQKIKEEADILRSCLEKSQDQIALLMSDKTKLLNEMSQLQEQMSSGSSWVFKNSKI
ncbi:hypothetical protein JTB14_010559 [Gonioctena quinquepunctata]|nr:hypothetical protein JTB14_010559 [Gonioctena quinquepunctata]